MKIRHFLTPLLWLIIGLAGALGWLDLAVEKTPLKHIDQRAQAYYDRSLTQALGTYAVARGINAVISVVQGSQVAVSPAGVGVQVAAGEILDPLNDLIERFSWVVLAAATSLGIQKLLIVILSWTGFHFLLPLAALVGLTAFFFRTRFNLNGSKALHLLLLAILLRYLLPVTAILTDQTDRLFLETKTQQASLALESAMNENKFPEAAETDQSGLSLIEKVKRFFNNIGEAAQLEHRIAFLKNTVTGLVDRILDLIVIFVLKTLIIPLLILWVLGKLVARIFQMDPTSIFWRHIQRPRTLLTSNRKEA